MKKKFDETNLLVPLRVAVEALSLSEDTLRRMEKRGELVLRRIGSRTLIPTAEIERLLIGEGHPAEQKLQALREALTAMPSWYEHEGAVLSAADFRAAGGILPNAIKKK